YLQRADGEVDEQANTILQIFNDSGLNAQISSNVFESIWSKATLNSVLNPLCTILNKTIYEFGNYAQSDEMIMPIID
ncbi:2-dehydropantoate 2-reductase, partial [Staphylococcus aureus]|nr:2-dehydropantoate 2-reductase [Staphylococcus aureus]